MIKDKSDHIWIKLFPFIEWLPMLKDPAVLRADFITGLTVAMVLIPQSMAYANLAGLPAYFGLYIAFMPVMVAALWGLSKQLGTGPVAAANHKIGNSRVTSESKPSVSFTVSLVFIVLGFSYATPKLTGVNWN